MAGINVFEDSNKVELINVLPSVTRAELYEKAKIHDTQFKNQDREVFNLDLKFHGDLDNPYDSTVKTLAPGDSVTLVAKDAKVLYADHRVSGNGDCVSDPGLAYVPVNTDKRTVILRAIKEAELYYQNLSTRGIEKLREMKGHSDAEVERQRNSTYSTYFLARAKEELIREHREKLEAELTKKSA